MNNNTRKRRHSEPIDGEVSTLREALELVEAQKKITTAKALQSVGEVWQRLSAFPAAKVVFSSTKISDEFFDEEGTNNGEIDMFIEKNLGLWLEIAECREFPCCRGTALGKHLSSSYIISIVNPLKEAIGKKKTKKISAYSDLIEVLLKYTDVDVREEDLNDWDEIEVWINETAAQIPILASIVDPVFMIIRGNEGGPAPGWIQAVIVNIPVGRNSGGVSVAVTAANTEVRQAPGQPRIPDMFRIPDMADARVVRAVLQAHANRLGLAPLQILRVSVPPAGFSWL